MSSVSLSLRKSFVDAGNKKMSIKKPCKLLGVPRSSYYHKPKRKVSLEDKLITQEIDRIFRE